MITGTAAVRLIRVFSICLAIFVSTSCMPWGTPKQEPTAAQNITAFKTLFEANCSGCHGRDGKNGPGRPLNDPLYLSVVPKEVLQDVIENGRAGTAMPAWAISRGGPMNQKQISAMVEGIEQSWARPIDLHGTEHPSYAAADQTGDADRGKKLFVKDCFMCHGPGARVGLITGRPYLALVSNQGLRTSIIAGRADLGMPDYRYLNMGHALSSQDVTDLVAYLASFRPAQTEALTVSHNAAPAPIVSH